MGGKLRDAFIGLCESVFDKKDILQTAMCVRPEYTDYGNEAEISEGGEPERHPSQLPPLVLAYVGDSVYELYVRGMLAQNIGGSVHKLHTMATGYARSASQADVIRAISPELTEREQDIVRRGRNANSGYVPKNADVIEYRHATGFEALLGYLYLSRDFERLAYILNQSVKRVAGRNGADDKTDAE